MDSINTIKKRYDTLLSTGNIFDKAVIGMTTSSFGCRVDVVEFMNEKTQLAFEMRKLKMKGWIELDQCIEFLEVAANEFFKQV